MRVATLLAVALAELCSAYAIPMAAPLNNFITHPARSISHLVPRDDSNTDNGMESKGGVIAASVIFGIVVVVVVVVVSVLYFKDRNICCTRRKGKGRPGSIFSTTALKEDDAATKEAQSLNRTSFASERESIMYSRSRSSSMNFAVVDPTESKPFVQNVDIVHQHRHQVSESITQEGGHNPSIPLIVHHPPQSPASESAEIVYPSRTSSTSPEQYQRRTSLGAQPRRYSPRNIPAAESNDNNEYSPMLSRERSNSDVSPV